MNIIYKVVDMNIKDFAKNFYRGETDFQDKILLETKNPYDLTDLDGSLIVIVDNEGDLDWFTVEDIVTDAEDYREFLAIPFN